MPVSLPSLSQPFGEHSILISKLLPYCEAGKQLSLAWNSINPVPTVQTPHFTLSLQTNTQPSAQPYSHISASFSTCLLPFISFKAVIIYSPSCHPKPVRSKFIFGTQINVKYLNIFYEIREVSEPHIGSNVIPPFKVQKGIKDIDKVVSVTTAVQPWCCEVTGVLFVCRNRTGMTTLFNSLKCWHQYAVDVVNAVQSFCVLTSERWLIIERLLRQHHTHTSANTVNTEALQWK